MTLQEYKDGLILRMSQLREEIKEFEDRTGGNPKYLKSYKHLQGLKITYDDVRRTLAKEKNNEQ